MNNEKILSLLTLQLNHIKQLKILLDEEKQALVDRDHESIVVLATNKQTLMKQLESLDLEISSMLVNSPFPPQANELKDQVVTLLTQCHVQNTENGKAIDLSMNSIGRLQRALIKKRAGNSMTYNAKGKTRGGQASNGYISA